jgi:hypothetical protein
LWHVWGEEEYMRVMVGKPKGRRPYGRHTLRGEDNIKIGVNEMEWESVHYT